MTTTKTPGQKKLATHTPGPWRLRELINDTYAVYGEGEYDIIFPTKAGINANARLIAASPLLLEACTAFVNSLSQEIDDYPDSGLYRQTMRLIERGEQAIGKATGEEVKA